MTLANPSFVSISPLAALRWQLEMGVDVPMDDTLSVLKVGQKSTGVVSSVSSLVSPDVSPPSEQMYEVDGQSGPSVGGAATELLKAGGETIPERARPPQGRGKIDQIDDHVLECRDRAIFLAKSAATLDDLKAVIAEFDGIPIRRHATNLVFSDGHPQAKIMVIGDAPGADEDRLGRSFVGASGQLLDRMFQAIGLSRLAEDPDQSFYISNILNWRPPGNRTPTASEIEVSLPFIERHIALVQPKMVVFFGGVAAKALLGTSESITKQHGRWVDYRAQTSVGPTDVIRALPTYHPSFLLQTPSKKREAWGDLLMIQAEMSARK